MILEDCPECDHTGTLEKMLNNFKASWEGSKRKREVYLNSLIYCLSVDGDYVTKIRDGKLDELDSDKVEALHKKMWAYLKIIEDTRNITT